jgi:PKD domain-containing protein
MRLNDWRFFMLLVVVALLSFSASTGFDVSAQQKQQAKPQCPTTQVSCPDSVEAGGKLMFTSLVSGGDQNVTPTYNWTVSAGSISSGQGTSTIEVDTSEVPGDSTVTATVDVGGFDRECGYGSTAASCTTTVIKKPEPRKLDEYGKLQPKDENTRLDNFVIELQTDPAARGYIIAYGGRAARAGDARKAADNAKDYLVKKRGLDPSRVMTMDGGLREQPTVELWIVPSGAQPPKPEPTVKPGETKPPGAAKPKKPASKKS